MSFECVDCGVLCTSETDLQIHEESHRGNEAGPSPSGRNSSSTQFVSIDDDVGTDSDDESSVVTRVSSCRRDLDGCSLGDPPKRERPPKSKKVDQGCTCTPGTSFATEDIRASGKSSSISGSNEENDVHMMSPPKNTFIGDESCQPSFNVSSPAGMSTSAPEQLAHQGVDSASERTNDTSLDPILEETEMPPIKLEPTELGPIKRNAELISTTRAKSRRRDKLPAAWSTEYRQIRNADAKRRRDLNATRYSCDYCDFTASFPSKLKLHLASNHTKGRFKCLSCTAVFDTQSEQRKHLSVMHPLSHYCEKCGYSNKKAAYVRRHIQQVHQSGRQFQCTVPGCKVMLLKQQLKAHLSSVHHVGAVSSISSCLPRDPTLAAARGRNPTGPQLICPHCQFQVDTTQELDEHIQLLHGSGVLCPMVDCDERVHLDQLEMHISTMHPNFAVEMPAPQVLTRRVPSCGDGSVLTESETTMTSSTTTLAEDQMLSSSDEEDEDGDWNPEKAGENRSHVGLATKNSLGGYDCSNCAGNFSTIYLLKKHVKRVHARQYSECKKRVKELKHKCTWEGCTKAFRTIGFLEDHLNKHKGLTPYQCDHCRQSFFARARFAVHLSKYHQTSIRSYKAIGNALPQMHNGAGGEETTT